MPSVEKVSVHNGNKTCVAASLYTILFTRYSFSLLCQLFTDASLKIKNMNFNRERNNESPWVSYL